MNSSKRILYITSSYFPSGQAYSTRVMAFAGLFHSLGYSIHVIADKTKDKKSKSNEKKTFIYGTYEIIGSNKFLYRKFLNRIKSCKTLKNELNRGEFDAVIMNASPDRFNRVINLCKKNKTPFILEICEWYDYTTSLLEKILKGKKNDCMMQKNYVMADGIIVISRYLERFFLARTTNLIRIPTIFNIEDFLYDYSRNNLKKIILIHAGCPVIHKENFLNIFKAIKNLINIVDVEFRIYGSSKETVIKNIGGDKTLLNSLSRQVKLMGTVPYKQVNEAYVKADYSIFIREDKRSSHAGFPTKLAESMAAGTPVITNDIGDVSLYLKDGINGYILNDYEVKTIENTIIKISLLKNFERQKQRYNARLTAERSFDFMQIKEQFERFLNIVHPQLMERK